MKEYSHPRDWQTEWERLYHQLDRENRLAMYRLMRSRLHRDHHKRGFFRWPKLRATPAPVKLSFLHAVLTFAGLGFMPRHPLTIPTAVGISLAVVVYLQVLSLRLPVWKNR